MKGLNQEDVEIWRRTVARTPELTADSREEGGLMFDSRDVIG